VDPALRPHLRRLREEVLFGQNEQARSEKAQNQAARGAERSEAKKKIAREIMSEEDRLAWEKRVSEDTSKKPSVEEKPVVEEPKKPKTFKEKRSVAQKFDELGEKLSAEKVDPLLGEDVSNV